MKQSVWKWTALLCSMLILFALTACGSEEQDKNREIYRIQIWQRKCLSG